MQRFAVMTLHHARRGAGEPLMLVHGIGSHGRVWAPVLGRLAERHDVVAIDLPGFGRSSAQLDEPATVPAFARAVAAFARASLGWETFHVAGNSMGGGIALELARTGTARTACALSPLGFAAPAEHRWLVARLRATRALARASAPAAGLVTRSAPGRVLAAGGLLHRPWRAAPDALTLALRDLASCPGWDDAIEHALPYSFVDGDQIAVPVTIAWGRHDTLLIERTQAPRARRRLPQARHVRLLGCGHVPTWDDPEQVAQVILETCATQRPPRPARARRAAAEG